MNSLLAERFRATRFVSTHVKYRYIVTFYTFLHVAGCMQFVHMRLDLEGSSSCADRLRLCGDRADCDRDVESVQFGLMTR